MYDSLSIQLLKDISVTSKFWQLKIKLHLASFWPYKQTYLGWPSQMRLWWDSQEVAASLSASVWGLCLSKIPPANYTHAQGCIIKFTSGHFSGIPDFPP